MFNKAKRNAQTAAGRKALFNAISDNDGCKKTSDKEC
jgi:hypothetical protein